MLGSLVGNFFHVTIHLMVEKICKKLVLKRFRYGSLAKTGKSFCGGYDADTGLSDVLDGFDGLVMAP